ncbi:MAG: YggT family protein [candidate division WOR-3 bacterium]
MENFLALTIDLYCFIIFVSAILSWFDMDRNNDVVRFIDNLANVVLNPIRNFMFYRLNWNFPIDISPIIAVILLQILKSLILKIL